MKEANGATILSRRAFVRNGMLLLGAAAIDQGEVTELFAGASPSGGPTLRIGMVTDLHYAEKGAAGTRFYRESLAKLAEAAGQFKAGKADFVVELGDLVDAAESIDGELEYLRRIDTQFAAISRHRHYVLGNHCVYTLTKQEFLSTVEQERSYHSFDEGDCHFIILDACFRGDGVPYGRRNFEWTDANLPIAEIEWLRSDLQHSSRKSIVFVHQRLDVADEYGVRNASAVRSVLEDSGKVLAVFQGHSHQNAHTEISGIHYCTLRAMVEGTGEENSGYSLLEVLPGNLLRVSGFRRQDSYRWP